MNRISTTPAASTSEDRTPGKQTVLTEVFRFFTPIAILLAGIAIFSVSGFFKRPPQVLNRVESLPQVTVAPIQPFEEAFVVEVDGTVVPHREVTLAAEVGGRIAERSDACRAGRFVAAGTLLCTIDPADYKIEVARLEAEIRQAELQVSQVDVELANTEDLMKLSSQDLSLQQREVERLEKLLNSRTVTASETDRTRQLEIGSRNAVQTLRNRQRLLEAQRASLSQGIQLTRRRLEQAELDLRRTRIEAPFDGMIDDEMIEKDSFVQPGSPLVRMEDLAAVEVSCRLRPDQIFWIWQSPDASAKPEIDAVTGAMRYELPRVRASVIYSLAGKKFVWQGQLSRYEGVGLDPQTRTIPCRILVPHADQGQALAAANSLGSAALPPPRLMNGMFVTVQLHVQPRMQLAAIPRQALRLGNVIWRVKDGRLSIIPVRVAKIVGENALLEIDPAIHFGEQVITSPLAFVEDGLQVEIRSLDTPPKTLAADDADADTRASKTEGITEPL